MPFPFLALAFAGAKGASSFLKNKGLGQQFDQYIEDRQRQTDIQVQNLAGESDQTEGRIVSSFMTRGGAGTSGVLADLQNTNIVQTSRKQIEFEAQENQDLEAQAANTTNQMSSPLIDAAQAFMGTPGGAESLIPSPANIIDPEIGVKILNQQAIDNSKLLMQIQG